MVFFWVGGFFFINRERGGVFCRGLGVVRGGREFDAYTVTGYSTLWPFYRKL